MNTFPQLREVENVVNTFQARMHFYFVRYQAHKLQQLEGSNVPWTELALIAKMHYASYWRHLEIYKVTNFELKLATMLIRITFLSALGGEHMLSNECNLLFRVLYHFWA
jgi:hypothetical protein